MSETETSLTAAHSSTYIGIDLGTSNCAAAVWDSTRGHPKWMRLEHFATTDNESTTSSSKPGRVLPSAILLTTREAADQLDPKDILRYGNNVSSILNLDHDNNNKMQVVAFVGHPAQQILDQAYSAEANLDKTATPAFPFQASLVSAAFISSAKRAILSESDVLFEPDSLHGTGNNLPFRLSYSKSLNNVVINIQPLGSDNIIQVTPVQVMAILLQTIQYACERYLKTNIRKKHLQVPGGSWNINHCVIGVPAHFDQTQRQKVLDSAHLAGFSRSGLVIESTAAAMAYGLFVSGGASASKKSATILVFDMGGGTTDITIAEQMMTSDDDENDKEDENASTTDCQFKVRATAGNSNLGGDEMDRAIAQFCVLTKANNRILSEHEQRLLLRNCKRAKEELCRNVGLDGRSDSQQSTATATIEFDGNSYELTPQDLRLALEPFMVKVDELVETALERYAQELKQEGGEEELSARSSMKEVILVGGGTRVFVVREFLRSKFRPPRGPQELCLSVNAMSAVAQGAAVQAAINSQLIPLHELQSAMMLDTVPHDIGVLMKTATTTTTGFQNRSSNNDDDAIMASSTFVCLIPRGTTLPASGSATFQLANVLQNGVTINAVEKVQGASSSSSRNNKKICDKFVSIHVFNFLLYRPSPRRMTELEEEGGRFVDIEMTLKESGEFIVAVVDENDPEQQRKLKRQQRQRRTKRSKDKAGARSISSTDQGQLHLLHDGTAASKNDDDDEEGFTREQQLLVVVCIVLFLMYVSLKFLFQEHRNDLSEL
ncbi:hypothetical protein ACA910_007993 [Epithemia clementina (nom. ined.)]